MSINATISGTGVSATTVPTALISDVVIGGGDGNVYLEALVPSTSDWVVVSENLRGAFSVATPDPAITYRFRTTNESQSVAVYFAP